MLYYRVKKEYDNKQRPDGSIYVHNELYTEKEVEKYKLNKHFLDLVEVSKRSVYWFFGARFCEGCGLSD